MNLLAESWRYVTRGQERGEAFVDLVCRYSDSTRYYHSLEHLREMLRRLFASDFRESIALHRALWWHDAIYDATRHDNEAQSAALAASTLAFWGEPADAIEPVCALILATRHQPLPMPDAPTSFLLDLDLSILAASPERYALYAAQVREEYAWTDAAAYAQGRAAFLQGMLARAHLFTTLDEEDERRARENMERELARWKSA